MVDLTNDANKLPPGVTGDSKITPEQQSRRAEKAGILTVQDESWLTQIFKKGAGTVNRLAPNPLSNPCRTHLPRRLLCLIATLCLITTIGFTAQAQDIPPTPPPPQKNTPPTTESAAEPATPTETDAPTKTPSENLTPDQRADFELWKAGLIESTNSVARRTAATKLLESTWPESYTILGKLLQESERPEVVLAIADALADRAAPPLELLTTVLRAYQRSAPAERASIEIALTTYPAADAIPLIVAELHHDDSTIPEQVALIELLSQFVEIETIDALIPCLEDTQPEEIRAASRNALESITGVTGMGHSILRWQDWWNRHRAAGREGLLAANLERLQNEIKKQRQRDRENKEELATLLNSLIHFIEQTYALTPTDRRSPLLVDLLEDQRVAIRALGLRLIEQAMSNGERVTEEVEDAVASLVNDPSPGIRTGAIGRLTFINGQVAGEKVTNRLITEENPTVRAAIYNTLARYPSESAILPLVERYTKAPGRAALSKEERKLISQALAAGCRAGFCPTENTRNQVALAILSGITEPENLPLIRQEILPEEVELLGWSTLPESETVYAKILSSADNPQLSPELVAALSPFRVAVARGLAASRQADQHLFAAAADPLIHPLAFGVLRAGMPGIEVLKSILTDFKTPSPEVQATDIAAIMAELPLADWLAADEALRAAADRNPNLTLKQRAGWLRRILAPANTAPEDHADNGGMIRRAICLRLAELELKLGRAENALAALHAAPVGEWNQERFDHLRNVALIVEGRTEEIAENAAALPRIWLEAIAVLDQQQPTEEADETTRLARLRLAARKAHQLGGDKLTAADRAKIAAILTDTENILNPQTTTGTADHDENANNDNQTGGENAENNKGRDNGTEGG